MFRSQRGLSSAAVESARRKAPQIHLTSVHGYIGLSTVVAWALEALTRCAVARRIVGLPTIRRTLSYANSNLSSSRRNNRKSSTSSSPCTTTRLRHSLSNNRERAWSSLFRPEFGGVARGGHRAARMECGWPLRPVAPVERLRGFDAEQWNRYRHPDRPSQYARTTRGEQTGNFEEDLVGLNLASTRPVEFSDPFCTGSTRKPTRSPQTSNRSA
jgi:hypothetical protein